MIWFWIAVGYLGAVVILAEAISLVLNGLPPKKPPLKEMRRASKKFWLKEYAAKR